MSVNSLWLGSIFRLKKLETKGSRMTTPPSLHI